MSNRRGWWRLNKPKGPPGHPFANTKPSATLILALPDKRILVDADTVDEECPSFIGGVPVTVRLAGSEAVPELDFEAIAKGMRDEVLAGPMPITISAIAPQPPEGSRIAELHVTADFTIAQQICEFVDDLKKLTEDATIIQVAEHGPAWLDEAWRWFSVLGCREPVRVVKGRPRPQAMVHNPAGGSVKVTPQQGVRVTGIHDLEATGARHVTALTPGMLRAVCDLVGQGVAAPVAPLLMLDAVRHAVSGDLRTAMVLGGTATDLVLDRHWENAVSGGAQIGALTGTLGGKLVAFEKKAVPFPLGSTRADLQREIVAIRNVAAHGGQMPVGETWDALAIVSDMVRELWPEGSPSP